MTDPTPTPADLERAREWLEGRGLLVLIKSDLASLAALLRSVREEGRRSRDEVVRYMEGSVAEHKRNMLAASDEAVRLTRALRELGHEWCREHCDGDDHTNQCNLAFAAIGGRR